MTRASIAACLLALLTVRSSGCDDDGPGTGSTDSDTDADTDADTDTDTSWTAVPTCMQTCDSPADCAYDDSPLFGADNYLCDAAGHCAYAGCNGDQECVDDMGDGYGCSGDPGDSLVPACVRTCLEAGDCAEEYGIGAYDYDNYECKADGYCKYLGCNDSGECSETHQSEDYLCLPAQFLSIDTCQRFCEGPADCDLGAGEAKDADNYLCNESACVYTGCNSTGECEETAGMGDGWECVEP